MQDKIMEFIEGLDIDLPELKVKGGPEETQFTFQHYGIGRLIGAFLAGLIDGVRESEEDEAGLEPA